MIGIQPYIAFRGQCAEAIEFYKSAIGAEMLYAQKYSESPMKEMCPPGTDGIMHCTMKLGDTHFMLCDDFHTEDFKVGGNISMTIGLDDTAKAKEMFDGLADGGNVTMPLDKTFWAEAFGMLTDKFGINWMVNCDQAESDHAKAIG